MFDVRSSLARARTAMRAHKLTILLTVVVTLVLIQVYIHIWPPMYQAEAVLMAEQAVDTQRDAFYVNWNVFRKDDPRTEIELLSSGGVLMDVIKKENLSYDDVYHPPLTELSYLWEKSYPGQKFKEIKEWIFPPDPEMPKGATLDLGRTLTDLKSSIKVTPVGDTSLGHLLFKGPSRRVAHIANTLLDSYMTVREQRHQEETQRAVDVLTVALRDSDNELAAADLRRVAYAQQHHLVFDLSRQIAQAKDLNDIESDMAKARARVASLDASLTQTESYLRPEPTANTVSTATELNTIREATKLKKLELESALIGARDHYREDSPEVTEIKSDIAKFDRMIAQEPEKVERSSTQALNSIRQQLIVNRNGTQTELRAQQAALATMEATRTQLESGLVNVPEMQQKMRDLDRDFALAQEKYQALKLKRAEAVVSLSTVKTAMPSLRVVDYATPPAGKSWPRLKYLYPGGLLVGLILGLLGAMMQSYFGDRIVAEDLSLDAVGMPVYAVLTGPEAQQMLRITGDGPDPATVG